MDRDTARNIAHDIFKTCPFESYGYSQKGLAQKNLMGKTHYVDDQTLRYHKSRVLACYAPAGYHGTICTIVESCALDMHNTKRKVTKGLDGIKVTRLEPAGPIEYCPYG